MRGLRGAVAVAAVLTIVAGCSTSSHASSSRLTGRLTVLAAASLTEAFQDDQAALAKSHRGLAVTFSFAGSQQLVAQVREGAPADVIATADPTSIQPLVAAHLVDAPRVFAHNSLELLVAAGNPKHIGSLADLARPDVTVVLADSSVPAGRYARQVLDAAHVGVHPASLELEVKSVVRKVAAGEADAGIVYVTDARAAGSRVSGVMLPAAENAVATYPVAVVRATHHRAAADAFVAQLLDGAGHDALARRGFAPA